MTPAALLLGVLAALVILVWPRRPAGPTGRPKERPGSGGRPVPRETAASVATALDLLALALGSSVPLVEAVSVVAQRSGPIVRRDLSQVVAALRWGVDERAAWNALPPVWRPAGRALTLAATTGVPPAGLLHDAAEELRRQERASLDQAAARLGVRIVVPLGLCFLPAFALLTIVPAVAALAGRMLGGS